MSNNQKAVKYNPSDSKNVIPFALLRIAPKVFIISAQGSKDKALVGLTRKAPFKAQTRTGIDQ